MRCNVCSCELSDPIYSSDDDYSLTSLCTLVKAPTTLWFCSHCGHVQSVELEDTSKFYDQDYKISLGGEDEDQIYEKNRSEVIFRTQHQAKTMLGKLKIKEGARILDYGCAKSSTLKYALNERPDIDLYLFDVSEMYLPYWEQLTSAENIATHVIPESWINSFDIVSSFFALEHIPEPVSTMKNVYSLLKDEGVFYGIVPNPITNYADFVVVDHVNHFTPPSLYRALREAGFTEIHVDETSHRGALVFIGKKNGSQTQHPDIESVQSEIVKLTKYWSSIGKQIEMSEEASLGKAGAIYGAGFYGAYILSKLNRPDLIKCFLDQSPYLQGKSLFGKRVINPKEIPTNIDYLYVGLNPTIAKEVISTMSWIEESSMKLFFLDGEEI
jgi:SAM-dependent methyltransferase